MGPNTPPLAGPRAFEGANVQRARGLKARTTQILQSRLHILLMKETTFQPLPQIIRQNFLKRS
jgi:hypothetical protein